MATILTLITDLNRNTKNPGAYRVELRDDPFVALAPLRQVGPVENGIHLATGVYSTRKEAVRAAAEAIGTPCRIVQDTDWINGDVFVHVTALDARAAAEGYTRRTLASVLPAGVFVAADAT